MKLELKLPHDRSQLQNLLAQRMIAFNPNPCAGRIAGDAFGEGAPGNLLRDDDAGGGLGGEFPREPPCRATSPLLA